MSKQKAQVPKHKKVVDLQVKVSQKYEALTNKPREAPQREE